MPEPSLGNLTVLVTRPTTAASRLSNALRDEGAHVIELPTIQIEPPLDWSPVDAAIAAGHYDWVVFSSSNGVDLFLDRLQALGRDPAWFDSVRVAAIGPETAARLRAGGITPTLVPDEYVAEALVAEISSFDPLTNRRVLLPSAEIARDTLANGLAAEGASVDRVTIYRTVQPDPSPEILAQLRGGNIQVVTFTSASTVNNLVAMLGGDAGVLQGLDIACIGPITADAAREHGLQPTIVATTYTIPGLVTAIRGYYLAKVAGGSITP